MPEKKPITVAAQSKAWTVFALSNAWIVGSNPTVGMDVCVRLFYVCEHHSQLATETAVYRTYWLSLC
jgi:hypothetical protein